MYANPGIEHGSKTKVTAAIAKRSSSLSELAVAGCSTC